MSLFWRVCLLNGLIFAAGTTALVLTPATVSAQPVASEVVVLLVGLSVLLAANAILVRVSLAPLQRLAGLMDEVDMLHPGQRLPADGSGEVQDLVTTFNRMIARLESERGASAAAAVSAQESERARIAQELHDEIGQSLTVILLGLKRVAGAGAVPPAVRDEILSLSESVRSSLEEVGQVARRLRPGVLEDLGLVSALTELTTEFSRLTGIPVRRALDPGVPALSREAELVLFRIAQESLTNIARHAEAGAAQIRLAAQPAQIVLEVRDDGRGLRGAEPGAGVRGMRERAVLIGARLELESLSGGGTRMRLSVPHGGQP